MSQIERRNVGETPLRHAVKLQPCNCAPRVTAGGKGPAAGRPLERERESESLSRGGGMCLAGQTDVFERRSWS